MKILEQNNEIEKLFEEKDKLQKFKTSIDFTRKSAITLSI